MEMVEMTPEMLDREHICCALGAKSYEEAVHGKKNWLKDRMTEGLVFYRLDERAKVFIEYLPAEAAWVPVDAPNYMMINCLWVSGKYKGQGYGRLLLEHCIEDARNRGMDGIVHVLSGKKLPYLSDRKFFLHHGFRVMDEAGPYYELAVLKWNAAAPDPIFRDTAKSLTVDEPGVVIYYTPQCPFASGILPEWKQAAEERGIPFGAYPFRTREEAQGAPAPWTTFAFFYNGRYISHEMMSRGKFEKYLDGMGKDQ
ncbi:acetyltransferase (GNAT) family protein [Fontibacillus phaseoli]|uniref:Acetyltransferase (GNAT) family protein n=1 Tax=Fontibacillus phaseoli TaxID=1416533 RepID=A0A369B5K2_9BACL|nr:GNAT family N-acetyltransferase [Fontibacillus phaseoli]RCX16763.1 acetyltransferase (GNAT) family protein [Fontibacillus phaseoli]